MSYTQDSTNSYEVVSHFVDPTEWCLIIHAASHWFVPVAPQVQEIMLKQEMRQLPTPFPFSNLVFFGFFSFLRTPSSWCQNLWAGQFHWQTTIWSKLRWLSPTFGRTKTKKKDSEIKASVGDLSPEGPGFFFFFFVAESIFIMIILSSTSSAGYFWHVFFNLQVVTNCFNWWFLFFSGKK